MFRFATKSSSIATAFLAGAVACQHREDFKDLRVVRIGHFPNITHVHGLVAHQMTVSGEGWFESRLGGDVKIEWYTFNAGPSAMEALLADSLDMAYVGPSPAINAFVKTRGREVRVVAGATRGGAALVVRRDGKIRTAADFKGKRIATPQLGNTQDVACRGWLVKHGFRITQTGGDAFVIPTQNADQLDLFKRGELDAVWTVEPWVSRLELEAQGRVFLEESDSATTVLVSSARFLERSRMQAFDIVKAHDELTDWIVKNPEEAKRRVIDEIQRETKRPVSDALMANCWPRLRLVNDVKLEEFEAFVCSAKEAGFLRNSTPLTHFVSKIR